MKFWDSSAVVALLVDEPAHRNVTDVLAHDQGMLVSWATPLECLSALIRRTRDGSLDEDGLRIATQRLRAVAAEWHEVLPTPALRSVAERMLRVHVLRATGALQLAAAVVAAEHDPPSLGFVCLDERLIAGARREGFTVE